MSNNLKRRDFLKNMLAIGTLPFAGRWLPAKQQQQHTQNNVLLLVFDALSARHIGLHGYERNTMPNLARWAERSTVYHNHYATGNFTSPGTASLLTGTYPWTHRAFNLRGTVDNELADRNIFQQMQAAGYTTAAYTHNALAAILLSNFSSFIERYARMESLCLYAENVLSRESSDAEFDAAFSAENAIWFGTGDGDVDALSTSLILSHLHRIWRKWRRNDWQKTFAAEFPKGIPSTSGSSILFLLEDAIDWVVEQTRTLPQPYFGYFHFLPPHDPYAPRHDFATLFDDGWKPPEKPSDSHSQGWSEQQLSSHRRDYDQHIAYADAELGRLLDSLDADGSLENTTVIITADHGELFERGILGHLTPTLYEGLVHIPLVVISPKHDQRRDVRSLTSAVDIVPTVLSLANRPIPAWCEGEPLPGFGGTEKENRVLYGMEAKLNPKGAPLTNATFMLRHGDYKVVQYVTPGTDEPTIELFDVVTDPEEIDNIYSAENPTANKLVQMLNEQIKRANARYT